MARTPTAAAPEEETSIKIKAVTPRFAESDVEALQLEEDLERMGCLQLLNRPWGVKSEYMIRELRVGTPNQFAGTLQALPNQWTSMAWRKTYGFGSDGDGICTWKEDFTQGKYSAQ